PCRAGASCPPTWTPTRALPASARRATVCTCAWRCSRCWPTGRADRGAAVGPGVTTAAEQAAPIDRGEGSGRGYRLAQRPHESVGLLQADPQPREADGDPQQAAALGRGQL